jgi:hypothetical protein
MLRADVNKDGHHRVSLSENGVKVRRFSHQLICEAWHGPSPSPIHMVCHRDDDKSNNVPENIYWGTRKDNGADAVKNGRSVRGASVNTARLSEIQVIEIREKASLGVNNCQLGREYGIPNTQISRIVRGLSWKHVSGPIRGSKLAGGEMWVDGVAAKGSAA